MLKSYWLSGGLGWDYSDRLGPEIWIWDFGLRNSGFGLGTWDLGLSIVHCQGVIITHDVSESCNDKMSV